MPLAVPHIALPPQSPSAPNEAESIAAYELLAAEYDLPTHETTRLLEQASLLALERSGLRVTLATGSPWVVELGTGTGGLSTGLLEFQSAGRLLVSDPAPQMLRLALAKLEPISGGVETVPLLASATEALSKLGSYPDLVVAGLSDPYLSAELLQLARKASGPQTLMFATLPGSRWAKAERSGRLCLPIDQTRFRLTDGSTLRSRSAALTEMELSTLFNACGFETLRRGTVRLPAIDKKPAPEVVWMLARAEHPIASS